MSKRAFASEGAFSSFNGVMLGWLRETKKVYDGTLYNTYIGTTVSPKTAQNVEIDVATARGSASTELEADKLEAFAIAQAMADLFVEMGDYSRSFNDYENLRSYAKEGIKVIWNAKWVNKIRKVDLPTIFHKDGLVEKFEEKIMPARYFGVVSGSAIVAGDNDGSYRSVVEKDYTVSDELVHVFPGDLIPAGVAISANEAYVEDENVICKVLVKLPPLMSAFEVGTTFFNPRSLTENHYLTFGHNTIQYLKNYPFITVTAKVEADAEPGEGD